MMDPIKIAEADQWYYCESCSEYTQDEMAHIREKPGVHHVQRCPRPGLFDRTAARIQRVIGR